MDKTLIKNLAKGNYERAKNQDDGEVEAYRIVGDEYNIVYWNSSNGDPIRHSTLLTNIIDYAIDDITNGTATDGWNEIMFEEEIV